MRRAFWGGQVGHGGLVPEFLQYYVAVLDDLVTQIHREASVRVVIPCQHQAQHDGDDSSGHMCDRKIRRQRLPFMVICKVLHTTAHLAQVYIIGVYAVLYVL